MNEKTNVSINVSTLFENVSALIERSRKIVATAMNTAEVYTKFFIGKYIVDFEQNGERRAQYGKQVLKELSNRLTCKFGSGWSYPNLKNIRQFYLLYSSRIFDYSSSKPEKAYQRLAFSKDDNSIDVEPHTNSEKAKHCLAFSENEEHIDLELYKGMDDTQVFKLSWSHYLILIRVGNHDARSFYEIECAEQQWSVRELSRQVGSSLYERLALSRDKDEVMRLAREGQTIEKSSDILKNPLTLEFLGLKPDIAYSESNLENAIINKMQQFLLELGKGFLFEARQKRFTFDEKHFYVDLVCYNRLLQCYVLIDLKTGDLTHEDLGQMQMYVNYYDRYVRQTFEKPTVGILLCERKNDAIVQLTLPEDTNIYASQYSLYLPEKNLLQQKLKGWIDEFSENKG